MRPGHTASFVAVLLTGVFAASADAGAHSLTASSQANRSSAQPLSSSFTIRAAPDTTKPSAAVLSATPGDRQITLAWTAATDNVAVTRYEVWKDNAYVTGLSSSARSYTVTGLTNGASHSFRVVAYDAAGNYANSNTVSAAANG